MAGFRGLIVGQQVDFESKLTSRGLEAVMVALVEPTGQRKAPKAKQTKKTR